MMKEFIEEYGGVVFAILILVGVIQGFATIFLNIRQGGV